MESQSVSIQIYETEDGKQPFSHWFHRLKDQKAQFIIAQRIERIRLGNYGDCKSVGDQVFELRMDYGPGYRLYFAKEGKTLVLLLCGGDKSSQVKDIKQAQAYLIDYRRQADA